MHSNKIHTRFTTGTSTSICIHMVTSLLILIVLPALSWGQTPDFVALTKQLKPAVVNISSSKSNDTPPNTTQDDKSNFFDDFFRTFVKAKNTEFLGSGFIITNDGYILTNSHVVENAVKIKVQLAEGKIYPATVRGIDPKLDLALLKISSNTPLPTVTLGSSEQLQTGEWVMAIGNPFGLEQTVTVGIVSAKGRVIGSGPYDNFIQTDASINPGNSGGPLFNTKGEVVGINTAIVAGAHGIGFALPIDTAKTILPQLRTTGHVTRGWLGVTIQRVSDDLAASFNLPATSGALITSITANSPAQRAMLQRGDIMLEFNHKKINTISDVPRILATVTIDSQVDIVLFRNGETLHSTITIEQLPAKDSPENTLGDNPLGITTMEITAELQRRLGLKASSGVVITSVQPDKIADNAKLQPGDVILEYNNHQVNTTQDLHNCIAKTSNTPIQRLLIQRQEALFYTTINLK